MSDIAKRCDDNPILSPQNLKASHPDMIIECLLNPGTFVYKDKIWLLIRVAERTVQKKGFISVPIYNEEGKLKILDFDLTDPLLDVSDPRVINYNGVDYLTTISHLRLMYSDNGVDFKDDLNFPPIFGSGKYESYGIEDCRVSKIANIYYLTYTMVSENGVGVGLQTTTDWKKFEHKGMIFPPHNKDCVIFEEAIDGVYYALHRPSSPVLGGNYIWLAESPDTIHWGNHQCLAKTRSGYFDSARLGAGAAPIKTDMGWLVIYHGADKNHRYCLGAMLLDLKNPTKIITRSTEPIMEPESSYEQIGFFGNVVFTNGHVVTGDLITLYYGASDQYVCMAHFSINKILEHLSVN